MKRSEAEKLVATLEALAPGAPWADALRAAEQAVTAQRGAAVTAIWPPEIDAAADFGALDALEQAWPRGPAWGMAAADTHDRSIRTRPALAAAIRGAREQVGAHAATHAGRYARPEAEVAAEAIARFEGAIATQLVATGHALAGAAERLLEANALAARLAAVRARHEEHARAALAALEAERLAAEAAREAEARRVAEAAAQAERQAEQELAVARERSRVLACEDLARRLSAARRKGLTALEIDGRMWDLDRAIQVATSAGFSAETVARYGAALDAQLRKAG